MRKLLALAVGALMALTLVVGVSTVADIEPASAHHGCKVGRIYGSATRTIAYNAQYTSNNCRVQARLSRTKSGTSYQRVNYYSHWAYLEARVSSWSGTAWTYGNARNCGRIKVPSTGYVGGWYCTY